MKCERETTLGDLRGATHVRVGKMIARIVRMGEADGCLGKFPYVLVALEGGERIMIDGNEDVGKLEDASQLDWLKD